MENYIPDLKFVVQFNLANGKNNAVKFNHFLKNLKKKMIMATITDHVQAWATSQKPLAKELEEYQQQKKHLKTTITIIINDLQNPDSHLSQQLQASLFKQAKVSDHTKLFSPIVSTLHEKIFSSIKSFYPIKPGSYLEYSDIITICREHSPSFKKMMDNCSLAFAKLCSKNSYDSYHKNKQLFKAYVLKTSKKTIEQELKTNEAAITTILITNNLDLNTLKQQIKIWQNKSF